MTFRTRATRAALASGVAVVVAVTMGGATAFATTGAPTLVGRNASDPWVWQCSGAYLCMVTSNDLNKGGADLYPMETTYAYTWDGAGNPGDPANWDDRGAAFNESSIDWVPNDREHLWAPFAIGGPDGRTYLYVPDSPTTSESTSQIAYATSGTSYGPFMYEGRITFLRPPSSGTIWEQDTSIESLYMSDPFVFQSNAGYPSGYPASGSPTFRQNGPARWLLWANGTWSNCGGISIALLDDQSMSTVLDSDGSLANNEIVIDGWPNGFATGDQCQGKGRPYIEDPNVYWTQPWGWAFGTNSAPEPYMLVVPAQRQGTGQAIIYASAADPRGPYHYRGTLMDESDSSWTNQSSIVYDTNPSGQPRFMFFYHDDSGGTNHNRKTHVACLTLNGAPNGGSTRFNKVSRPSSTPDLTTCRAY